MPNAASGASLAILPCQFGDGEPALVRLTGEVLGTHTISLVYRRDALLSDAVRKVKRFAIAVVAEQAKKLSGAH